MHDHNIMRNQKNHGTYASGDSEVLVTIRAKCTSPCSVPGGNCDTLTSQAIPIGKTCRSQKPPAAPEQADSSLEVLPMLRHRRDQGSR